MLGLTFASLRSRPLRAILTALSIVLGVAMISGTFVLTGQINRAFSEIFDAVNVKNDVVDRAAHRRARTTRTASRSRSRPRCSRTAAEGAGRRRGDGRDRRPRLARQVRERHAQERRLDRRGSAARVLDLARALRPGTFVSGRRARARRRDRAARGHGRQGRREGRHDASASSRSTASSACASSASTRSAPTASLGGALVSSIPLADAQRWYGFDGPVHAGQPAGRPRRLARRAARPRAQRRSAAATRCRPATRRRRPTRRASPT